MKRSNLVKMTVTSIGQHLPSDWEIKAALFKDFVIQNKIGVELQNIGNMDKY